MADVQTFWFGSSGGAIDKDKDIDIDKEDSRWSPSPEYRRLVEALEELSATYRFPDISISKLAGGAKV